MIYIILSFLVKIKIPVGQTDLLCKVLTWEIVWLQIAKAGATSQSSLVLWWNAVRISQRPKCEVWQEFHYMTLQSAELSLAELAWDTIKLPSHHLILQNAGREGGLVTSLVCLVQGDLELVLIANEMKGFTSFHVCPWELHMKLVFNRKVNC